MLRAFIVHVIVMMVFLFHGGMILCVLHLVNILLRTTPNGYLNVTEGPGTSLVVRNF